MFLEYFSIAVLKRGICWNAVVTTACTSNSYAWKIKIVLTCTSLVQCLLQLKFSAEAIADNFAAKKYREFELAAAFWKIERDMLRTKQFFSLSPNRISYSYDHHSLILTPMWQHLPSSLEMFSLAKEKLLVFSVLLLCEDTGKSCEQHVPYLLGQTM